MSSPIDLTVIVAAYNVADSIEACLASVLSQSGVAYEIICIDNGSTDGTIEKVERVFANAKVPTKLIRNQKNLGLFGSRQVGIAAANGKAIMFVDGDDALLPGGMEAAVRELKEFGADSVLFDVDFKIDGDVAIEEFKEYFRIKNHELKQADLLAACIDRREFTWNVWNKIYRTEFLRKALANCPEDYLVQGEDFYQNFLIFAEEPKLTILDRKIYLYSIGGGRSTVTSGMQLSGLKRYFDYLTVCRRLTDEVARRGNPPKMVAALKAGIIHTAKMFDNILFKRVDRELAHRALNLYKKRLVELGLYDQFTGGREMSNLGFEQLRSPIEEMEVLEPQFGADATLITIAATEAEADEVSISIASAIRAAKKSAAKFDIVVISGDLPVRDRKRLKEMSIDIASVRVTDKIGFEAARFEGLKAKVSLKPGEVMEGDERYAAARETPYYEEILRKRFATEIRETYEEEISRWEKKLAGVVSMYEEVTHTTTYRAGRLVTLPLRVAKRIVKIILRKGA